MPYPRRIVRDGHEIVPRFRVITPEGDWIVFVPLPDDLEERYRRMHLVGTFMAWKMATAFVLCNELFEPDAISVAYVGRNDRALALRKISRKPLSFVSGAVTARGMTGAGHVIVGCHAHGSRRP